MANKDKKRVKIRCSKHPDTELVCPKCVGGSGGKTTAKRYSKAEMTEWGRRGGRPRKVKEDVKQEAATGASDGTTAQTAEAAAPSGERAHS